MAISYRFLINTLRLIFHIPYKVSAYRLALMYKLFRPIPIGSVKKWLLRCVLLFLCHACPASALCTDYQRIYFFGDSLTDSGYQNNNPDVIRIHKTPQWTSPGGHVWAYYFMQNVLADCKHSKNTLSPNNKDAASLFSPVPRYINPVLNGNNYAAGGATTGGKGILNTANYKSPSLLEQVDYYVNHDVSQQTLNTERTIYLIWSGSNDIIKKLVIEIEIATWLKKFHIYGLARALHIFDLRTIQSHFVSTEQQIAHNLTLATRKLLQAGATHVVILLLPDVSVTPLVDSLVSTFSANEITKEQLAQQMHAVIMQTNVLIHQQLNEVEQVLLVDINKALASIVTTPVPGYFIEQPSLFGKSRRFYVQDTKNSVCPDQKALTCIPHIPQAKHYVFEDLLHPTDQTHQILGDFVYFQVDLHFKLIK
mgnify:CR=1 FL=1